MDALFIGVDGKLEFIQPKNRTDFSLEELYDKLNCNLVEVVYPYIHNELILIIDEEGKLTDKKPNLIATAIFENGDPHACDYIVGDAILCHTDMFK